MDLDRILTPKKASEYSFPGADDEALPDVYGDWLSADVGDPASTDVATPCTLINRLEWVYAINARQTVPTQPVILFNGVLQDPSVAVWNPADNYEGRGVIATLRFLVNPTNGVVSVRHGGAVDNSGQPITNPVRMLYQLLQDRAGWTLADFDRALCEQTAFDMDALGYPAYGCFQEERTVREWLRELLPQYHTDFTETGSGQLGMILDRSVTTLPLVPDYHIPAYEVMDDGSGVGGLRFEAHGEDVVNQITLRGRYNWSTGDYTAAYAWAYAQSQSAYAAAFPATFSFRQMYTGAHAIQWMQSHGIRHGFEPRAVSLTLKTLRGLALIPPRFVTLEWPPLGWVQHLLKVRAVDIDWESGTTTLECVDCRRELSASVTSPTADPAQRRLAIVPNYQWIPGTVGDNGQLIDAPSNPKNEAANGNFERGHDGSWDLQGLWTIVADGNAYEGTYALRSVPNTGLATVMTLRSRIDPGEWVLISGWFKSTAGASGAGGVRVQFYDQAGTALNAVIGTRVNPTTTYLESVLFVQAPAGAYYYRPGVGMLAQETPSTGTWWGDKIFAASGMQHEVLLARQGDVQTRNLIVNGDFELGPAIWNPTGTWFVTNDPTLGSARSGTWYAAHGPTTSGIQERLNSFTKIAVIPGETFTFSVYAMTVGTPNGTGQIGVTWLDAQGNSLGENVTVPGGGPIATWTQAIGSMTVPANASTAHVWVGINGHSGPADSYWLVDDAICVI
jgi:hypothetical protein